MSDATPWHEWLCACRDAGTEFVNISPLRTDVAALYDPEWIPVRPNTDAALMLALAHVLSSEGLHDRGFLDRYTVGFDRFSSYLFGEIDGTVKDADWAGPDHRCSGRGDPRACPAHGRGPDHDLHGLGAAAR